MTDPAPLTPPDCDLRPFRDMPLDIGRFRRSDLVTHEDPDAVLAALLIWGAAWHEVPAASVPDNDKWLAKAAGYGRAVDAWLKVREGALRGFVRCSDGRLYNRTLAEKANAAWEARLLHEWRRAGDRHRKAQRALPEDERTQFPDFEAWLSRDKAPLMHGERPGSGGMDDLFRRNDPPVPADSALKGMEGNGREGNGVLADADASAREREFVLPAEAMGAFRKHRRAARKPYTDRAEHNIELKLRKIWDEHGHDPTAVLDQSIRKGWLDVFPLKGDDHGRTDRAGADDDKRTAMQRALDKRMGRD